MKKLYLLLTFTFNCWIISAFAILVAQVYDSVESNSLGIFQIIFFIFDCLIFGYLARFWNLWFYKAWKYQQSDTKFLYNLIILFAILLFFLAFIFLSGASLNFKSTIASIYTVLFIIYIVFDLVSILLSYLLIKIDNDGLFNSLKRAKKEIKKIKKDDGKNNEIEVSINNYLYVYKFPFNCLIYDISQRYLKISNDQYLCSIINIPLVDEKIDKLEYFIVLNNYKIEKIYKFSNLNKCILINKDNFNEVKNHFNLQDSLLLKNAINNYILNVEPISEEEFLKYKKTIKKLKHNKDLFIFYNF